MNELIQFFLCYLLSFFGFSLGKSTKDEHKEVKIYALNFSYAIQIILSIFILFFNFNIITLLIVLISGILIYLSYFKNHSLIEFNSIFLYSYLFFTLLDTQYIYFSFLSLLTIIIENSFEKFNFKNELYKIILIIILSLLFYRV